MELVLPLYDTETPPEKDVVFKDPAFTENRTEAIHRWIPWIAGFSAGFAADCLREYLPDVAPETAVVLDPFAGVGTTLLEAYRHGFNTVGFEINPYAALAARAKMEAGEISLPLLEFWLRIFQAALRDLENAPFPPPAVVPPGFRSRIPFFSKPIETQVLNVLAFIRGLADPKLRDLFLVAFGSVMVKFSNYTYEPSLTSRPGSGKPLIATADVVGILAAKLAQMAQDCRALQKEVEELSPNLRRSVIQDSIFSASEYLPDGSIDLAITSPPYLNNYHYIRNTRPHLFWLEMIEDTTGLRQIEEASFGKFWQTVRDGERIDLAFSLPDLEAVLDRLRKTNTAKGIYGGEGWANYAAQYFNDTDRLCAVMQR
ncbi:MAG TPA: DNA methyltransferase, partial [Chthonomonadaceae bacterium]|nr:DNA methyltransferase [Chthonomonadaceae bacterium]